ncbi:MULTISPECIES: CRISPR-associated endonuclease Cas2 [Cyanophyceae]|uniref:CRISPR-associated endonuclease Cas2 n=1 Tax=Cyanophyceae TaxID=3028117 RepID=UPI001688F30C|nr:MULTISPECIES: CRISPR-associated endonuclease Cas2 [Cyanophyceae]MBD1914281.1 CRISPR-associated endonuclease Cas2 [Phormidium sp. FACHB-77]MBD2031216.1 CRISPR-associated endonuclease Cas2 [Phormidium sp. FACHB-322]MBD2049615.1 CRISPR-associated endonuclease Cas2 [Leptolyngbya sp. FACHB-60]
MFLYIVAYDIPSNRRRKKVSDILEGYGKRVQYSVFELVLAKSKYDDMKRILSRYVNFEEDSLRFYPISQHTLEQVEIWGGVPLTQMQKSIIV